LLPTTNVVNCGVSAVMCPNRLVHLVCGTANDIKVKQGIINQKEYIHVSVWPPDNRFQIFFAHLVNLPT
jgi:hypothetical protein